MPRVALLFFALFASLFVVLATPIPVPNSDDTIVDLQKRITHSGGRVRPFYTVIRPYSHIHSSGYMV